MTQHAACSPSSAAMWLSCPASVTLTKDMTRPSSRYAREGTAAHKVAEMILKGDIFLPDKVKVENEEFIVSVGMCRALNPYVTFVQAMMLLPEAEVLLEKRLVVPGTGGVVWGTLDCGVYVPVSGGLVVADLKYGTGVAVAPDAPQLKLYALALAGHVKESYAVAPVTLVICQPRIDGGPLRVHETTLGELWGWHERVVMPAVDRIREGDPTEVVGAYCRWCVRRSVCKAYQARHQTHAAEAFDDDEGTGGAE